MAFRASEWITKTPPEVVAPTFFLGRRVSDIDRTPGERASSATLAAGTKAEIIPWR